MCNEEVKIMNRFGSQSIPLITEPKATPSILAKVPNCLKHTLENATKDSEERRSVLISSNNLANRFVFEQWKIRPSQRRRYRHLFAIIRKQSREVFNYYLSRGRIEWKKNGAIHLFGVYKFDDIRGNLILGFVNVHREEEWKLPLRKKS
jgi:hypothetical protein